MTDFDAVCARLRSKELCAVAASEGVVWGQIKGYPFWPVRLGYVLARSQSGGCSGKQPVFTSSQNAMLLRNAKICTEQTCGRHACRCKRRQSSPTHCCPPPHLLPSGTNCPHRPRKQGCPAARCATRQGRRAHRAAVLWGHDQGLVGATGRRFGARCNPGQLPPCPMPAFSSGAAPRVPGQDPPATRRLLPRLPSPLPAG